MWQDLCLSLRARVSISDVEIYVLQVVKSLLSDEHEATLETDVAESLLMLLLQMLLQGLNIVELKPWVTLMHHALSHSQLCPGSPDLGRLIVDILVLRVYGELLLEPGIGEVLKSEGGGLRNQELLAFSLANGTLLVLHDETQSQDAGVAHVLVVALA